MAVSRRDRTDLSPGTKRIPRACSDVFRLWAAVGLGLVLGAAFEIGIDAEKLTGLTQLAHTFDELLNRFAPRPGRDGRSEP